MCLCVNNQTAFGGNLQYLVEPTSIVLEPEPLDAEIERHCKQAWQEAPCPDCGETTVKAGDSAKIGLDKLLFVFYAFLRFNTSIHQLDAELTVSYWSLRQRVEQLARTLDAPAINLVGPVKSTKSTRLQG